MAKQLTFSVGGKEFSAEPNKVDRKKLYGWSEVFASDDDGSECVLVAADSAGIIIPKGGLSLGILSSGKWIERSDLKTVTLDGKDAELIMSSYGKVNELTEKATEEELLDCSISAFYHLADSGDFIKVIGDDIYKFEYCFRDSYETSPAFLIVSELDGKKELFMLVGVPNDFSFIGLNETAIADEETGDDDDDEESDDIDFGMF